MSEKLLELHDLDIAYGAVRAVNAVSLEIDAGETLAVVGESGCGKSSLGRAILGLVPHQGGRILWRGQNIATLRRAERHALKRRLQIVFQDPTAAFDPRLTLGAAVAEPLAIFEPHLNRRDRPEKVREWLDRVELPQSLASRYPHEVSGGQCQRAAIARAMILGPELLVCDEAVSALDVSVQAQIVALLDRLRRETGLSLLFISHNLAVVGQLAQRVAVMYLGRIVEIGPVAEILTRPRHPYTQALISAVPVPDPAVERIRQRIVLAGEPPSPASPPGGCVFHPRCPQAMPICTETAPDPVSRDLTVACHLATIQPLEDRKNTVN